MQRNIFSPKVQGVTGDLSVIFHKLAQGVLVLVFGLLPVFFMPGVYTTIGFMKAYWLAFGLYVALVLSCLALLRSGKIELTFPVVIISYSVFAVIAVASALLSGDTTDSLFGTTFDVYSAGFLVLLACVMLSSLLFVRAKTAVTKLFLVFSAATVLVYLFAIVRFIFGSEILSFGIFNSNLVSPLGSLNDLALFSGFILIIILLTAHKVSSTWFTKLALSTVTLSSLFILMVVNFSFVWIVIGFFALLTFLYLLAKDTWFKNSSTENNPVSRFALALVAVICLVTGSFIVSGDYFGAKVAALTNISYLEVRPSLDATLGIAKAVYKENALFGIGPNRFEDAWRLYKDPIINETQFWNTTFTGANSFASTIFIGTGLAGLLAFSLFIIAMLYTGYRLFFVTKFPDTGWRTVGTIAFAGALYLWVMSFLYTPGASILLLAAVLTGLLVAVGITCNENQGLKIDVLQNKQHGFLLISGLLFFIVLATFIFISINKQFIAQSSFSAAGMAFAASGNVAEYDQSILSSIEKSLKQDQYVAERARLRLTELNQLLGSTEPTAEEQQRFQTALVEGIALTEQAIALDSSNPYNHALLGSFFGLINSGLYEGAFERRSAAFARARELDPTNPEYRALEAQLVARFGETENARTYIEEAIKLKGNYTDALFMLSQLDIQKGDTAAAIITTESIISLEPNNPARYFQLGLLYAASGNAEAAIKSFETAIALDSNYANARYMLAMSYLDSGRAEDALVELKLVQANNADNQQLLSIIEQVEQGSYINPPLGYETPVQDDGGTQTQDDITTSNEIPDTDLVSPVNQIPSTTESDS